MVTLSSSPRLLQLLNRTRDEIISKYDDQQVSNTPDENDDDDDDEILDIVALTGDIQNLSMIERGNELRDCARYNDYIVLHTILYVTATSSTTCILNSSNEVPVVEQNTNSTSITSTTEDPCNTTISRNTTANISTENALLVQQLLHSQDESTGNTALHMAAANNHSTIVEFLLQIELAIVDDIRHDEGSRNHDQKSPSLSSSLLSSSNNSLPERSSLRLVQRTNTSGQNTPLHYAVTNRALESIRFLLYDFSNMDHTNNYYINSDTSATYTNPYIDVLQQNSAGRSSLTEAFALTSAAVVPSVSSEQNTKESEGTKRDHDILTLLLEHPSANEERLIQSSSGSRHKDRSDKNNGTTKDEHDATLNLPPCHTHHFRLVGGYSKQLESTNIGDGIELYIREMAMAPPTSLSISSHENDNNDSTLPATISKTENNDLIHILGGTEPMSDTTGYGIWSASIIMGQWMTDVFHNIHRNANDDNDATPIQTIVELGAGCGVPGITIAKSYLSRQESSIVLPTIYVTDLNPVTLQNLQHNVTTNHVDSITSVVSLDWNELIHCDNDDKKWPWMVQSISDVVEEQQTNVTNGIDILIGSDLVYQKEVVPILIQTIQKLRPRTFYYGAAGTNRDGHDLFIQSLQNEGRMTLVSSFPAPHIYRTTNPLYNQDDDECFIHFQDLLLLLANCNDNHNYESGSGDNSFTLYEFTTSK